MWSTPSSIARGSTARAALESRGGPSTPGPASCIAPKPMRLIGLSPRNAVVFISPDLSKFEKIEAERRDLPHDPEQRGPILEQAGEPRLAALLLRHHRGKGGQGGSSEPAPYPDRVQ